MYAYDKLHVDGSDYETRLTPKFRRRKAHQAVDPAELRAVIPGTVLEVLVSPGQEVARGAALLILQAMKMHNPVAAVRAGRVAEVHVQTGQQVARGDLLISMDWDEITVH